jgi:hypothetical protein
MSTTPDSQRADDQIVTYLSHWLTRQLGNDELRRKVEEIDTDELAPGGREAVRELLAELGTTAPGERAQLEVLVREAVETLVYGDGGAGATREGEHLMFTGLVREVGTVRSMEGGRLVVEAALAAAPSRASRLGESARGVRPPAATASTWARSSCTARRLSSPVTQRSPGTVTRPSSVTAAL